MNTLDEESIDDLMIGASLLSSGSGCRIDRMLDIVRKDINRHGEIRILEHREAERRGRGVTFSVYLNQMEHIADVDRYIEKIPEHVRTIYEETITGIVAHALDTCDIAFALHVASRLDIPLIDCDCSGRGLIDYIHNIYFIKNRSLNPILLISPDGECTYLHPMSNILQIVRICKRHIRSRAPVIVLGAFSRARSIRRNYVCGTIDKSIRIGRELKKISRSPIHDLKPFLRKVKGYLLFRGVIEENNLEKIDGSVTGLLKLRGVDRWSDTRLLIYVRDGTIIVVKDNMKPLGMVPDIVTLLSEDYLPITYDNVTIGDKVHVIGIRAPEEWRTSTGLSILGPRYFGIDIDYIPIELLVN